MSLTTEEAQVLGDDARAELDARGLVLQGTTLVFPEMPLVGHWVEMEGRRFLTNDDAVVTLVAPPDTRVAIYEDFESTWAMGTFAIDEVMSQPQPATFKVLTVLSAPGEMNPEEGAGLQIADDPLDISDDSHCTKRDLTYCAPGVNTRGCCLDYDGFWGNGQAYKDTGPTECRAQRLKNFLPSTCFKWTLPFVCLDEAAYHRSPDSCWKHHKYRNCQNLSLVDFSASAVGITSLHPGETATLRVRNNLPSNDTIVEIDSSPPMPELGTLTNATSGAKILDTPAYYLILHYDEAANPKRHVEETEVTYTAPTKSQLPAGCTTVEVQVVFMARTFEPVNPIGGHRPPSIPILRRKTVPLTIQCDGKGWVGTVTYTKAGTKTLSTSTDTTLQSCTVSPNGARGACSVEYEKTDTIMGRGTIGYVGSEAVGQFTVLEVKSIDAEEEQSGSEISRDSCHRCCGEIPAFEVASTNNREERYALEGMFEPTPFLPPATMRIDPDGKYSIATGWFAIALTGHRTEHAEQTGYCPGNQPPHLIPDTDTPLMESVSEESFLLEGRVDPANPNELSGTMPLIKYGVGEGLLAVEYEVSWEFTRR